VASSFPSTAVLVCLTLVAGAGALHFSDAASIATSTTIRVSAGDDLQAALDRAQPGDTLALDSGATFTGNFVLPAKAGASYITIRSSVSDNRVPGEGQRILPAHAPLLAKVRSPNSLPALQTAPGAHHWRLLLLEIGPNATPTNDVVRLGDGSARQTTLEGVPHDLEVDRCYIHGDPLLGQKRGIALNSASTRIVNSYLADFKLEGQDTQAIAGWNGPGPYTIENNYLEAAGENVLFGGADPAIAGLVPADIRFRDNHVSKPVSWRRERWQVKNLFELKNATRVLIEHNLFEHNWQAAQPGPAILFTPRNQDGAAPWSRVSQVMFRANVVRHVAAALNILGYDNIHPSGQTSNVSIHHNLFTNVDAETWGGNGVFLLIGDAAHAIDVDHNTVMQSGSAVSVYGRPTTGFVFRNNLIRHNTFGIKGDSRASGHDTVAAFFPGAVITHNALVGAPQNQYPPANLFPSHALWVAQFRDYYGGDYELTSASIYRNAGTDGADLGADPELLARAFAAPAGRTAPSTKPPR
jgi:hypothetical protein